MTTTDVDDDLEAQPEPTASVAERYQPSAAYAECRSVEECSATFKALFAEAAERYGSPFKVPSAVQSDLGEDLRRALCRFTGTGTRTTSSVPRAPRNTIPVATVTEHDDGSLTITCVGACGETKSVKKFPTNRMGGRDGECRDCRNKRLAEQKAKN